MTDNATGLMCWDSRADIPDVFKDRGLVGNCVPVITADDTEDPFLAGFYWATSLAYDRLFGGILGPLLFEDATYTPSLET